MDIKTIIILILTVLLLFAGCEIKKRGDIVVGTKTEYIETIRVDTVTKYIESVPIPDPVETIKYKTVLVEVESDPIRDTTEIIRYIEKPKEILAKIPVRLYEDTIDIQGARLHYRHEIAGTLEDSKYSLEYYQETTTKETTTTITKSKDRTISLYGVGGYNITNPMYNIGGDIVMKRYKIGYRYGINQDLNRSHTVEVGIKLFQL